MTSCRAESEWNCLINDPHMLTRNLPLSSLAQTKGRLVQCRYFDCAFWGRLNWFLFYFYVAVRQMLNLTDFFQWKQTYTNKLTSIWSFVSVLSVFWCWKNRPSLTTCMVCVFLLKSVFYLSWCLFWYCSSCLYSHFYFLYSFCLSWFKLQNRKQK